MALSIWNIFSVEFRGISHNAFYTVSWAWYIEKKTKLTPMYYVVMTFTILEWQKKYDSTIRQAPIQIDTILMRHNWTEVTRG